MFQKILRVVYGVEQLTEAVVAFKAAAGRFGGLAPKHFMLTEVDPCSILVAVETAFEAAEADEDNFDPQHGPAPIEFVWKGPGYYYVEYGGGSSKARLVWCKPQNSSMQLEVEIDAGPWHAISSARDRAEAAGIDSERIQREFPLTEEQEETPVECGEGCDPDEVVVIHRHTVEEEDGDNDF
ncbi:MAG: hypothetical protein WCT24_00665 [Patescibacteria group bacterium]|jgi:hypothetical protein